MHNGFPIGLLTHCDGVCPLSWEPDPVEADSLKGGRYRRKVDILGMIVSIIGSKDQLVNEYRVMLAEKLLNKSDYDIDSEIRTLELLKIHFGESSMQKCEIMLNDLIDSKRTNTNIKATLKLQPQPVADVEEHELSLDNLNATIISSNFWPPIQLELQFEDRTLQFSVTPLHASIISLFEDQTSWTSKNLAASGILAESIQESGDHKFTLVEALVASGKTGANTGSSEELLVGDEEGETSVASVEDQLRKEMTVYEKFITGMLTNFGSMALDRIHNTLKRPKRVKIIEETETAIAPNRDERNTSTATRRSDGNRRRRRRENAKFEIQSHRTSPREEYQGSIQLYTQIISLSQHSISKKSPDAAHLSKLQKTLCLAFSNRAEAWARLLEFSQALRDCEEALRIEKSHFKTLLCKGKILLSLNRYSMALDCFKAANLDPQANENSDVVNGFLDKCKKLEFLSRTGAFDVTDWVLSGFRGKLPEFAEYVGAVEIRKSEISGRGLFATKNVESGTLLLVTKATAVDRAIMPQDSGENAQLVIWKNFIDKVVESATKCSEIKSLISKLSAGEDEENLEVPEIGIFRPEAEMSSGISEDKLDMGRMLSILDVNSMLEDAISAKVLGKNADYHGVGLWILASFINHSCDPNVRRLHIGDHVVVHAARDVKAGEELTFAYFDVLSPLNNRREMANNWGSYVDARDANLKTTCATRTRRERLKLHLEKG
ncbi:UNVERIFIED_CONTAM: Anaphase-promoting complex subunit [Sesamum radiatum]|uniref:Anaphase-promoting complex subunit 2 n=1 Tax=Sesamum radiatum TaxID=300843 RepID=A0AAW2RZW0_SESRA